MRVAVCVVCHSLCSGLAQAQLQYASRTHCTASRPAHHPIHAAAQEPPHTVCTLPKTYRLPLQNSPTLTLALHSRQSGLNSPSTFLLLFACHHTCNAAPPRSAMAAAGTAWCPCHRADGECRAACSLGSTMEHAKHHDACIPTLLRLKCAQTSCRPCSTGRQSPGRTHW